MALKYPKLLSPLKVRGVVLRNRMMSSASTPHFLQGPEPYPTEKMITHFANRAKSGAASIAINHLHQDTAPFPGRAIDFPPGHFNMYDMDDFSGQNNICQLIDSMHFYGAKATAYMMPVPEWLCAEGEEPEGPGGPPPEMPSPEPMSSETEHRSSPYDDGPPAMPVSALTHRMMRNYADNISREAGDLARLGFDIISVYSCYRNSVHARLLSPLTNDRTDEYGGDTAENRSRLTPEIFRGIRKAVGPNVPLEAIISVCDPEGGTTAEDTIEFCRPAEGIIDIVHLRGGEMDPQHPLGYTSRETSPMPYLEEMGRVCRAVHEEGINIVVGASAGFFDPNLAERALEEGKADLIYMAHSWISNPDYGRLVYEGRDDRIVPCIRCNKCHVPNGKDMWRSVCSVNPAFGLEDKLDRMIPPPSGPAKKIAVVGGGPAGMEFARVAAERGNRVVLYEASDRLGGQLKHADYASFKWPLRQFKDFMVRQTENDGIEVRLNTKAAPEDISAEGYDVVALAVGSEPTAPHIPGSDLPHVHFAAKIYGGTDARLSDQIVVIGGGEIGVETALYLCELGKHVMVLEQLPELITDAPHSHYKNMVHNYWMNEPNFRYQCGVTVSSIEADGVNYRDHKGRAHKYPCGDVLLAVGARPLSDEAMRFAGTADRRILIGDCDGVANVQRAMRSAWSMASTL